MKCADCPYCFKSEEDDFECCHFPEGALLAPCEYDDIENEEE